MRHHITPRFVCKQVVAAIGLLLTGTTLAFGAHIPIFYDDTAGQIIFDDDFERGIVGSPPGRTDPIVHFWESRIANAPSSIRIQNQASAGFAAFEGDQFVTLTEVRPGGAANPAYLVTSVEWYVNGEGQGGQYVRQDDVTMTFAFRPDGGPSVTLMIPLYGGGGIGNIGMWGDGRVSVLGDGNVWNYATVKAIPNQWNVMVIKHTCSEATATQWSLSINGSPFETLTGFMPTNPGPYYSWNAFEFVTGGPGSISIDAVPYPLPQPEVPEPSTLLLLSIAGAGLAICSRLHCRRLVVALSILSLLAAPAVAKAANKPMFYNLTTGNVLFDDNFENGTVGSVPGRYDPSVGQWAGQSIDPPSWMRIDDVATAGFAAYEGQKMLTMTEVRPWGDPLPHYVNLWSSTVSVGARDELMVTIGWHPSTMYAWTKLTAKHNSSTVGDIIMRADGSVGVYDGSVWNYATTFGRYNQWNTLIVKHTNGTADWSISINGSPFETIAGMTSDLRSWNRIELSTAELGTTSLDAVPERAADAIPILYNNTQQRAVLQDNFENGFVGRAPGQFDPAVGRWDNVLASSPSTITISNGASAGIGPHEGANFVTLTEVRPGGVANYAYLISSTDSSVANGDEMIARFAYRSDGGDMQMLAMYGGGRTGQIGFFADGQVGVYNGNSWDYLTTTAATDAWNEVVVKHTNGTVDWSISVNGSPFETKAGLTDNIGPWNGIEFVTAGVGRVHIDAACNVPEPSTIVLLAAAAIAVLAAPLLPSRRLPGITP